MKRLFFLALAATLSSVGLHAQAVDTTVCDVLKDPVSFNGKIVRIKGTVVAGFDQFVIRDNSCGKKLNAIWLSLPEGTKAKAGPALMIQLQPAANFAGTADTDQRTPVTLDKNKDFKQFDSQLSATYKSFALCLGCNRNEVSATLVGRLDGVIPEIKRNAKGQIVSLHGFGNLNMYSARLVLQSVSEVSSKEVNYSKSSAVTHDEMPTPYNGGDGFGAAHKAGQAFASNNPGVAAKIERAAAAFGKQGENNGVNVSFGGASEAAARFEGKATASSPDGVLFNCIFENSRLKDYALPVAIVFVGSEVADLRDPKTARLSNRDIQLNAWENATATTVAQGQKTLTTPGGYMLWNMAWTSAERDKNVQENMENYLTNVEGLAR